MLPNMDPHHSGGDSCTSGSRKYKRGSQGKTKRKRAKKNMDVDVPHKSVIPMDYISRLPEHIIHHILAFLRCPKDVARISALSTKWKSIWMSYFTLDFDQKCFKSEKLNFVDYVESSLTRRLVRLDFLGKFKISMTSFNPKKMTPRLDRWLASVVSKNVREIEIHIVTRKDRRYPIPESVLACESLTALKLFGCSFNVCDNMKLFNLRKFSMKHMQINTNILESIMNSCPLIEDLRFVKCRGFNSLHISNNVKLNKIEIHECEELQRVEISLPNLQSFWFCGVSWRKCTIDLKGCHGLRSLTLKKDANLTEDLFLDKISNFPVLETLVLSECNFIKRVSILSGELQKLVLVRCRMLTATVFDAPNLQSFEFIGRKVPVFSITAPHLEDAKICFTGKTDNKFNVQEVFRKITELKGMKLVVQKNKDLTVYEDLAEVVPDIQFSLSNGLKLYLKRSPLGLMEYINTLFSASHPKTITVLSPSNSELVKFLLEKMRNRKKGPNCCTYYSRKCWQHYVKEVTMSEIKRIEPENSMLPPAKTLNETTFSFTWGSVEDDKQNSGGSEK